MSEVPESVDSGGDRAGGAAGHVPVLLREVVRVLSPGVGEVYVDGTAGLGGHAVEVAGYLVGEGAEPGVVVLNDHDPANLELASEAVRAVGVGVRSIRGNFADLAGVIEAGVASRELPRRADIVLVDLGFASTQVDDPERGLSFRQDGPLDMRLDPEGPVTAADLVRESSEGDLADLIFNFGEERFARRVARKIVEARACEPIETTGGLAEIVRGAVPRPPQRQGPQRGRRGARPIDPATRTFQALRIAVNDELGSLDRLLRAIEEDAERIGSGGEGRWLSAGARVAVIAFHSLEDRPVKRLFTDLAERGLVEAIGAGKRGRKPIVADDAERASNPRSRSAKLRAIRLGGG